jgi:beta-phosphoglucomutase
MRYRVLVGLCVCWAALVQAHPLPTRVDAVIFDCDGVLVDTEQLKFEAWRLALLPHGVEFTLEDYLPMVGHSSRKILQMIESLKGVSLPAEVIVEKDAHYRRQQAQGVPPLQSAIDHARQLSEAGQVKLGLASSASQAEIRTNLKQIGLEEAFDVIVSGADDLGAYQDPTGVNKPKPYIYLETAKRLQVEPSACIVYEDTCAGVEAAAEAGMAAIAVPNRFTMDHDFSRASAVVDAKEIALTLGETKMRAFLQNKLWRDRAVELMEQSGSVIHWSRLEDTPFDEALRIKLIEEAHEVARAGSQEELCGELADLLELVASICKHHGITLEQVQLAQQQKRDERGSYDQRKYVTIAEHPVDSFGTRYCLADPEKYPEITR